MTKVAASVVICERVLNEIDSVASAIRLVDIFGVPASSDESADPPLIPIAMLVSFRLLEHDELEHTAAVKLVRPDGEESLIGELVQAKVLPRIPGAPGGFNVLVQIGVKGTQIGLHFVVAVFDGQEVARGIFTLLPMAQIEQLGQQRLLASQPA